MRLIRIGMAIIAGLAALTVGAVAFAHAFLETAAPEVGGKVAAAPTEISLTFTEGVEPVVSSVKLFGPNGAAVKLGALRRGKSARVLIAPIMSAIGPGEYKVVWRVVSVDGHVTRGDFRFRVKT